MILPSTFCVLPFISSTLAGHNKLIETDNIKPCCRYNGTLDSVGESGLLNSTDYIGLQKQFLRGEKPQGCSACWKAESLRHSSYRLDKLKQFRHLLDNKDFLDQKLRFLEITPGNACNLACRMCMPRSSSKWFNVKLPNEYEHIRTERIEFFEWSTLDLSSLEVLKLMGGEPTYQKKHLALLEHLDSIGQLEKIHLEMPTNLHEPFTEQWLEIFEKCKTTHIYVSIDGIGKVNDYVRQHSIWNQFENNLKSLLSFIEHKSIYVGISVTLSMFNINQSKKIEKYIESLGLKEFDRSQVVTNYPSFLDARNLKDSAKQWLIQHKLVTDSVKDILEDSFGMYNPAQVEKFKQYVIDLDNFYGTSFEEVNKDMYNLIFRS